MTSGIDRFTRAQERDFAQALSEIRAGRKRSHWIWYVFPQLAGLGSSPAAQTYGLQGVEEATAYLRDPTLRERLLTAADAVRLHLEADRPAALRAIMGSDVDALKLVSSMTLFREIARRANDDEMSATAEGILAAAAAQGYRECAFTQRALRTRT